jgi:cyclopropane fatty-acyl-phospholipid synthase-like methyltransferase
MMGPNSIKLLEELLANHFIKHGGLVLDLGCGQGLTSLFLVKEYGFKVIAADFVDYRSWCLLGHSNGRLVASPT